MGETISMEINWNLVALAAGLLFYGMLAAMTMRRSLKAAWGQLRALPRFVQTLPGQCAWAGWLNGWA